MEVLHQLASQVDAEEVLQHQLESGSLGFFSSDGAVILLG